MIGKITKGKGFKGVVNYILDPEKEAKLIDAEGIRLKDKPSIIQSMLSQAKLNPNVSKSVGHISLSFSQQDKEKLTDEFLTKIAREYMDKMGIKNTQYFVARHFDKDHPHIHICFNRIDNNGKTISDKNDRFRNEKICKELTAKYGLYLSTGKEKVKQERLKEPDKTKYEIYNALKKHILKCNNWNQLIEALQKEGIGVQFKYKGQTNQKQGITFLKNGYSFTGSKIDRQFSYSKINNQLLQNQNLLASLSSGSQPKKTVEISHSDYTSNSIGSLFVTHIADPEEEMPIIRKKKKKKKGRRL